MKKLLILILFFSLLIISGCTKKEAKTTVTPLQESKNKISDEAPAKSANQMRSVIKEDFTLEAPEAWLESESLPGVSLMMINSQERPTNSAAQKINFRSYFSVSYDQLGERNLEEQLEVLKKQIKQVAPDISFTTPSSILINGQETRVLEGDLRQQGVDFKVLIFMIAGRDKDIWIMSFNTLQEDWLDNKDLLYQIGQSFKLK